MTEPSRRQWVRTEWWGLTWAREVMQTHLMTPDLHCRECRIPALCPDVMAAVAMLSVKPPS